MLCEVAIPIPRPCTTCSRVSDGLSGEVARHCALLGDEQAACLDESAFAGRGRHQPLARMWNGRLGKVTDSQLGCHPAVCRETSVP